MNEIYFVDMDGTLAKWNIVSDEQLFEKDYFKNLEPHYEMVRFVNMLLSQKKNVFILSSYLSNSQFALDEKNEWLDLYLPNIDKNHRIFAPYGFSKAEYINSQGIEIKEEYFLIDDYTKNLIGWEQYGGTGIKYMNGINHTKKTWQGDMIKGNHILIEKQMKSIVHKLEVKFTQNKYQKNYEMNKEYKDYEELDHHNKERLF